MRDFSGGLCASRGANMRAGKPQYARNMREYARFELCSGFRFGIPYAQSRLRIPPVGDHLPNVDAVLARAEMPQLGTVTEADFNDD